MKRNKSWTNYLGQFIKIQERYTFSNGDVIEAQADTCFETDNRLDDDDPNYEEYHACAMEVVRIIVDKNKMLKEGQLIEINYHNYPQQIIDSQGNVL